MSERNELWDLKDFLEAVTEELDRARDLLRVKSINRPLTYTVKDLKLDLNVFAVFDGERVRFRTAAPGEDGASKVEFELGSITDRMVAETTKSLPSEEDVPLEEIKTEEIKPAQRKALRRLGVDSKRDVERLARRRVKVGGVDFAELAAQMDRAVRPRHRPRIRSVVGFSGPNGPTLRLFGEHMDEIQAGTVQLNGQAVATSLQPDAAELTLPNEERTGHLQFDTLGGETLSMRLE